MGWMDNHSHSSGIVAFFWNHLEITSYYEKRQSAWRSECMWPGEQLRVPDRWSCNFMNRPKGLGTHEFIINISNPGPATIPIPYSPTSTPFELSILLNIRTSKKRSSRGTVEGYIPLSTIDSMNHDHRHQTLQGTLRHTFLQVYLPPYNYHRLEVPDYPQLNLILCSRGPSAKKGD